MRRRHLELALRQQLLLLNSAELRARAARDLSTFEAPLQAADRVRAGWQWLKAHPEGPLTAAAVIALLRPRRALSWSLKAWGAWRFWRKLRRGLIASGLYAVDPAPRDARTPP
jgi:hypothetical protein